MIKSEKCENVKTKMRNFSRKMLKISFFAVLSFLFGTDDEKCYRCNIIRWGGGGVAELRRKMLNDAL